MQSYLTQLAAFLTAAWLSSAATAAAADYRGRWVEGSGDPVALEALDAAFESARPSARLASLPLMYKRDWNGLVESPRYWPGWWIQNSFGASYGMMPFIGAEEPYATWIANSQGLWFRAMGDGRRKDARGLVGPDGCLCDAAIVFLNGGSANGFGDPRLPDGDVGQTIDGKIHYDQVWYKQGDGATDADWFLGCNAAALVMEADRLLVRHDAAEAKPRLGELKRAAALLESRHDPEFHLLRVGKGANLLSPTYPGGRQQDGSMGMGFLTEISVNYAAGLERLAEVCLLCGEPQEASRFRATAGKIRAGLRRLQTPDGYFIRSEDPDGTRRGVFGAAKHGYFEAHPNHDAGAFRITDDAQNQTIVRYMLDRVKGPQEPGGLAPFGLLIPNFPGYDDHVNEGDMTYGTWTNGGAWPQNQGPMNIACMRAGEFTHPFASWQTMRRMLEAFRADAPLAGWGRYPWSMPQAQPYSLSYDAWGPSAGLMRGLFEYGYAAKGLRLWPHLPPGITRYVQKIPASFGKTRIFLAATGTGTPQAAVVNGRKILIETDGSVFVPLTGTPGSIGVEFLLGDAKPLGVGPAPRDTPVPPVSDTAFWNLAPAPAPQTPANSVAIMPFSAAGEFLTAMAKAGLGDTFEAGQARVVVQLIAALHERRRLAAVGQLLIPPLEGIRAADPSGVDQLYRDQIRFILGGLQDHLQGLSLHQQAVNPAVLNMARAAHLVP
ncbi:MAG: hypothetical protein NTW21_18410 [Verrucomicrobia bacterium]|nr:hypothetical protein [Verrucomicrobiota bacterium]